MEELELAPAKLYELNTNVQDLLLEVNLEKDEERKPTYVC